MQEYLDYFGNDKFASSNGIILTECRPGYAKAEAEINGNHLNGAGVLHGGMIFTIADFVFAAAVNSYGKVTLSINASVSYFSKINSGRITAEAREISRSNKLITCDINVFDEPGNVIANFKGTAFITKETIEFK